MTLSVEPINDTFAATVTGVTLAGMSAAQRAALRQAYLDHKILVIPDQVLSVAQFADVAQLFGEPVEHPVKNFLHPEYPQVMILSNSTQLGKPVGVRDAGSFWHSDRSYMERTADATLLYSVEVPDEGGDTWFADLEAIYNALDDDTKERIDGLRYVSQYRWSTNRDDPESRWSMLSERERANTPELERPVVRTHPETGRKSLFIFPGISAGAKRIIGLPEHESQALMAQLFAHMLQERFQFRFKWNGPGTVVVWDNRCVMHKATTKHLAVEKLRTLYRVSTLGGVPR